MDKLQYSIIYAVIRQEISEQLSVGMIIIDGSKVDIRYSEDKLKALKYLYPQVKYDFISKTMRSLPQNNSFIGKKDIDYLARYCNNLIAVSPLQTIDLEPNEQNKDWLFRNYVHSNPKN
ncbi:MAG: hypothetical protein K2H60_10810 [Muribaculaceae bacterium]|nr:hypothetical protein [Muribaculaceae bacterium]